MAATRTPPPTSRAFTIGERRSLTFERVSLYVVFLVALVAATVSFIALTWLGQQMRLPVWAAPLLPVMIDGFGVACSVGIVRSQAAGEPPSKRRSEQAGLGFALAISVMGNVAHVLNLAPEWLLVTVAVAIPIIVAYGIHVYGRALSKGISARVLVDQPDRIQIAALPGVGQGAQGERPAVARAARTVHVERAPQVDQPAASGEQVSAHPAPLTVHDERTLSAHPEQRAPITLVRAPERAVDPDVAATLGEDERIAAAVRAALAARPGEKPNAARLHAELGLTCSPATTRRKVAAAIDKAATDATGQETPQEKEEGEDGGLVADLSEARQRVSAR